MYRVLPQRNSAPSIYPPPSPPPPPTTKQFFKLFYFRPIAFPLTNDTWQPKLSRSGLKPNKVTIDKAIIEREAFIKHIL